VAARKHFTKKDRARIFAANDGACHICNGKIDGTTEAWEVEHVIPWALTQDDSDENLRPAHAKCHKAKTHGAERAMLNKTERQRLKNMGAWPKSRARMPSRPFPSTREARS